MSKVKIGIGFTGAGGVGSHVATLIDGLSNYGGYDVTAINPPDSLSLRAVPYLVGLKKMLGEQDIVHCHGSGHLIKAATKVRNRTGNKLVATSHGLYIREHFDNSEWNRWVGKEQTRLVNGLKSADLCISVSKFCEKLMKDHGVGTDVVIPNWIKHDEFVGVTRKKRRGAVPMILHAGMLDKYRNPLYLINSLADLKMDYRLVMTAGGKMVDDVLGLATRVGVPLDYRGWVPREVLIDLYSQADVVVNCNRHEIFGITMVEAMACGTPVVAPSEGAPPEYIVDGETGFLFDFNKPGDFASKVEDAVDSHTGRAARKFVLSNYTDRNVLPVVEEQYRIVLGSG